VKLLVLLALGPSSTLIRAQTIEIKLVNGRNGHPIAHACINVWVGDRSQPGSRPLLEAQTNSDGVTKLHFADEDTKISTQNQQPACGLSGVINPVVKSGDTVSIRAGYVLCHLRSPDYSWLAMVDFPTKKVLEQGIVTRNTCGKATASPKPGQVVIFVRPLTFWEKMKE
jgi:hypothetical protein